MASLLEQLDLVLAHPQLLMSSAHTDQHVAAKVRPASHYLTETPCCAHTHTVEPPRQRTAVSAPPTHT
eukprot:COSAG01_NODE_3247_length_6356_cov_29.609397_8_plen_68_part_00